MVDTRFWQAVGRAMRAQRERAGWTSVRQLTGAIRECPNERTITAIEKGRPGHVQSLSQYCAILRVPLRDVLVSALPDAQLSGEAMNLARTFDRLDETGQAAVRAVFAALSTRTKRRASL